MVVTDCQDCEKSTWVFFHARRSIGSGAFFSRYCTFFNHQILPVCGPKIRKCFPPRIGLPPRPSTNGIVAKTFLLLEALVATVGDITTILGFFFLSLYQKRCSSCGVKFSTFFSSGVLVLQPEVLVDQDGAQKNCLKTFPQTSACLLRKRATEQVLLFAHANVEVLPDSQYQRSP